jgi:hypothetical protein
MRLSPASGVAGAAGSATLSVLSSPRPNHERSSGWNGTSSERFADFGRRTPFATMPKRPCFSVHACRIRLVSR